MTLYHAFVNDTTWVLPLRTETFTKFFVLFPHFVKFPLIFTIILIGYYWINPIFFRNLALLTIISDCVNFLVKYTFKIPRPTIEHLVAVGDHNYSFPSGDTQVATTFWLALAFYFRNIYFTIFSYVLVFLVACSRVYIGVHYPKDVVTGFLIGLAFVWFLFNFPKTNLGRRMVLQPLIQQALIWLFLMTLAFYFYQTLAVHHVITKLAISSGILLAFAFLYSEPNLYCEPLSSSYAKIRLTLIGLISGFGVMAIIDSFLPYVDAHFTDLYPLMAFVCQAFLQFMVFYLVPKFYFTCVRRVVVE